MNLAVFEAMITPEALTEFAQTEAARSSDTDIVFRVFGGCSGQFTEDLSDIRFIGFYSCSQGLKRQFRIDESRRHIEGNRFLSPKVEISYRLTIASEEGSFTSGQYVIESARVSERAQEVMALLHGYAREQYRAAKRASLS